MLASILFVFGCQTLSTNTHVAINTVKGKPFDLQGHRGARGLIPENTIPAFIKALEIGVTTLEMDAVVSGDEIVVVSHEPWMSASICSHPDGTPVTKDEEKQVRLFEMTYAQIGAYDCGLRGNPLFPEQTPLKVSKPSLQSVFEAVYAYTAAHQTSMPLFNIEIKSTPDGDGVFHPDVTRYATLLYQVLVENNVLDRTYVQSFDERALVAMHTIDPSVPLVWLVSNNDGLEANLAKLPFVPSVYSPNHQLVDPELVREAHKKGMFVIPWTVNDRDRMEELIDLGVDGLITDYPDRAKQLLSHLNGVQ